MRYLVTAFLLLVGGPVGAQDAPEPDTLDWRGYFPLAVGNEWEYRLDIVDPADVYDPEDRSRTEYARFRVVGDGAGPDGSRFALVEDRLSDAGVVLRRDTAAVRYDAETASVLALYTRADGDGTYEQPVPFFACGLDATFYGDDRDNRCWGGASRDPYALPEFLGSADTLQVKSFYNLVWGFTSVHGIGFVGGGGGCEPCFGFSSSEGWLLTYARVGAGTYGARAVATDGSPGTGPVPDIPLRAYPNPTSTGVTVEGEGERVVVYDVLGRGVLAASVLPLVPVRLDVRTLPPGVYVVRRGQGTAVVTVR